MRDDRGQELPLASLSDLRKKAGEPGYPSREALDRVKSAVERSRQRSGIFSTISLIGLGMTIGWFLGLQAINLTSFGGSGIFAVKIAWLIAAIIITRMIQLRLVRLRMARQIAATLVAESTCGSCGYGLAEIAPDDRGFVVCPECGGAWLATRMTVRPTLHPGEQRPAIHRRGLFLGRVNIAPDSRGRLVPITDSRARVLTRSRRSELASELPTIRHSLRGISAGHRATATLLIFAVVAGVFAITFLGGPHTRTNDVLAYLLTLALFAPLSALSWRSEMYIGPDRIRRQCAELHRCASCLEDLRANRPGADGLTDCDRCGAGWKLLPTVTAPVPPLAPPLGTLPTPETTP